MMLGKLQRAYHTLCGHFASACSVGSNELRAYLFFIYGKVYASLHKSFFPAAFCLHSLQFFTFLQLFCQAFFFKTFLELLVLILYNKLHLPCTVDSPLNHVIILVTSTTLSPPSFIPNAWTSLPPFIQCGQELIIKSF